MRKHTYNRVLLGTVAVSALFAGSAFTASNTGIDPHTAGIGTAAVSGIAVTNIDYVLNTDRTLVTNVTFTTAVAPPASAVGEVQLTSGGTWFTCNTPDGAELTLVCPTPGFSFADADALTLTVEDGVDITDGA